MIAYVGNNKQDVIDWVDNALQATKKRDTSITSSLDFASKKRQYQLLVNNTHEQKDITRSNIHKFRH